LIVDTVGILPHVYIATKETAGVPSNGNMKMLEHIHLIGPDTLADDLEITAPAVLTGALENLAFLLPPACAQVRHRRRGLPRGSFAAQTDSSGNAVFIPLSSGGGR
jgi:hypothetical protein